MFKKNDIIVRINKHCNRLFVDDIVKVHSYRSSSDLSIYDKNEEEDSGWWSMNFRLATQQEINAYNRGIRNINDIKKQLIIQIY